jgi:predicted permease
VAGQLALALVIVSAAALNSQSLINLQRAQLAFEPSHLLVCDLAFRADEYDVVDKQTKLFDRLLPEIGAISGVIAVSPAVAAPFAGLGGWDARLVAEGQSQIEAGQNPMLNAEVVSPDYFRALGVRVLKGRALDDTDRKGALPVVVISQSAAAYFWPRQDPIGKRFVYPPEDLALTVVGVVDDTRYRDLRDARASIYFPLHQSFFAFGPTTMVIRTVGPPETVISTLRHVVASTAPGVTIARVAPFNQFMRAPLALPRMSTFLLVVFATAALLLAAVGLFGAMASLVRHRSREIGIRMALGASPREVQSMVLRRGLTIAGAGVVVGWLGALLGNRAVRSMLYAVSPTDVSTFAVATALLIGIALIATVLPARAAMRVDPGVAVRAEV